MNTETGSTADLECDHCGKRHNEVRKLFIGVRWDGKGEGTICDGCVFLCVAAMARDDRDWVQKQVEEALSRAAQTITGDRQA
jgi:hypothetical protein